MLFNARNLGSIDLHSVDLIAIPDFGTGAMENWGLITYRETSILYDPEESSTNIHEWIGTIVAHELAHQWFGNLVTMKWWNDLWLNEGAASFFEYKGVNHISPEWSMMDKFILEKTQSALDLDALASSHPISVQVKDPNEIEAIFDNISYNKGASILNMLEGFLCEDVLKSGLNDYLNSHAYGNADTNDLWAAFTKHANNTFDVKVGINLHLLYIYYYNFIRNTSFHFLFIFYLSFIHHTYKYNICVCVCVYISLNRISSDRLLWTRGRSKWDFL